MQGFKPARVIPNIMQIPEEDGIMGTDLGASGLFALVYPVGAARAFLRNLQIFVHEDHVIGTGVGAKPATGAGAGIDPDQAIVARLDGVIGADRCAGGFFTVLAMDR